MKNKKTKLIIALAVALTLSFSSLPLANAATTTPSTAKPTPSRLLIKENKLKERTQARATTTATSTKSVRAISAVSLAKFAKATTTASSTKPAKSTKLAKNIEEALKKADTEISKRIDSLNKVMEKIDGMKNVSDSEKVSLKEDLQSEITKLTALKSKISSDTDLATIKKDLASITSGSRIYMLVIPRANILASVDKINTIATMLGTVSTKLQARIDELKASGKDVTIFQTAIDNIVTKISDAKEEALTAQTTILDLTPDNGNKVKLDSNNTALKAAKLNIKTANQDLTSARKSASIVTDGLKLPSDRSTKIDKNDTANGSKSSKVFDKSNSAKR